MPTMLNITLARQRRAELGLTLAQLGDLVGVSRQVIQKWETGDHEPKNSETLRRYAKALGVHPGDLLGSPEPEPEVAATP